MSTLTAHLTSTPGPVSPRTGRRTAARIAGVGYVLLFVLAILANFVVLQGLVVDGDAVATVANLDEQTGLFRFGLVAFLVVAVVDVVVAWALFVVLREVHHDLALLAAWSRLAYTVMLVVGLVFFVQVLTLVTDPGIVEALGAEERGAQVMLALASFDAAWLLGLAIFGVHLALLGVLLLRGRIAPRALGVLLVVAGAAYVVDTLAHVLLPDYAAVANLLLAVVALPSMLGEGWLGLWLLLTKRLDGVGARG
ncbi:DUF4386 domain-containing protein [Actinotalea sp.]|uniref:DUF4386 domain-containing protein n=1 Tax=Actinotalea sp. TaxID=1872145 RepID=UPI00356B0BF2